MSPKPASSRETAIRTIRTWIRTGEYPDRLLAGLSRDRELIAEIVYGVTRWRRELEWLIDHYSKHPPTPDVAAALMTGFYQLRHTDGVPAYAAVNETVEAVRRMKPRAAGYVNKLLRQAGRDEARLNAALEKAPLGIRTSHPDLLVNRWKATYGPKQTQALCEWNNTRPETVLHVNTDAVAMDAYLARLLEMQIAATAHPARPDTCIAVPASTAPAALPGYAEGWFAVRDPSTSVAVELLAPEPGQRVLDACAAPGGKAVMMGLMMKNEGTLMAVDASRSRLDRVRENLDRMGVTCASVAKADATSSAAIRALAGDEGFDRILLDVPCTNTGVLRRRPDARWRFSEESLREAAQLQRAILRGTAPLLKPGGRLVYSTCSLEPEEGHLLISQWIRESGGYVVETERTVFPPRDGMDGAFTAAIRREDPDDA